MRQGSSLSRMVLVIAVLLYPIAGMAAKQQQQTAIMQEDPRNLVVITLDTTRADHLGCYGYEYAMTPSIDRLAADGVLFEQALTTAPLTLPAHASLFTGKLPQWHGVRANEGFLGDANLTLAEILEAQGFRTAAFIGAAVLASWTGMDQGFEVYGEDIPGARMSDPMAIAERPARKVIADAVAWLEQAKGKDRFFLWVHLFDPHWPYQPPEPPASVHQRRLYDAEIAYSDRCVGELLAKLQALGLREQTIVTLLSDHGEGLGEHGEPTHGLFLYETTLHIPWIISLPGESTRGLRIKDQVRIIDVMETLLALLGIDVETGSQGRSLAPLLAGKKLEELPVYAETLYPNTVHGWSPLFALRSEGWKLIDAPRPELYDLGKDPHEQHDQYTEHKARANTMAATLESLKAAGEAVPAGPAEPIDPERRQALESLGYVVSGRHPGKPQGSTGTALADPKDRLQTINDCAKASVLHKQGRSDEAIATLNKLLEREPQSLYVHQLLSNILLTTGNFRGARVVLEGMLAIDPANPRALTNLGLLALRDKQVTVAVSLLEQARQLSPDDPVILVNLGRILVYSSQHRELGRSYLQRFLELVPDDPAASMIEQLLADTAEATTDPNR